MTLGAVRAEARTGKSDRICQPANRRSDLAAIDRSRREARIPLNALLAASGIHIETYYLGKRGANKTRPETLRRLWNALESLRSGRTAAPPPAAIRALLHAAEELLRVRILKSRKLSAVCLSKSASPAQRIRTLAFYLLAVEIEIENADIARACGCTRQNVHKARETIETMRDDGGALDRLMTQCAAVLRGEA